VPQRPAQSISAEQTFEQDLPPGLVEGALPGLAAQVWRAATRRARHGRTVVLKLKTADFRLLTRHLTPTSPPASAADLLDCGRQLLARADPGRAGRYRLAGLGLTNFIDAERQAPLFEEPPR
jgi:DNA polymerase-4